MHPDNFPPLVSYRLLFLLHGYITAPCLIHVTLSLPSTYFSFQISYPSALSRFFPHLLKCVQAFSPQYYLNIFFSIFSSTRSFVNIRLCPARIKKKPIDINIIQVYAPQQTGQKKKVVIFKPGSENE